jgi:DNA uptake protein ComE-like DNA-binding protein
MSAAVRRMRRSFVLLAVLVIVTTALLVATSVLFMAQADLAGQADAAERTQSRLLAWSGVQIAMKRLNDARDRILEGERAELDEEYVVYERNGRVGVVRLLPVAPGGDLVAPEAARLDLNVVTAEELVDSGLVDEPTAAAIVRHRDGRLGGLYQSVAELLLVPGVTAGDLYGPLDDITVMDDAHGRIDALDERVADRLLGTELRGLADLVTVYAFEPALQRSGRLRINLNVPWSDELGRRVDERFGEGTSRGLKQLFDQGTTFESEAALFDVLLSLDVEPEEWPDIVDTITTDAGEHHFGRLDINAAPLEALQALPGLDEDQAADIVAVRETLDAETLATIAWPAIEGIVEPEAYRALGGRITTRTWTYRLRIAAGERDADAAPGDDAARLASPVIVECVIDLSRPEPRVAYLRDVTELQTAAMLAVNLADPEADPEAGLEDDPADERAAGAGRDRDDPSLDLGPSAPPPGLRLFAPPPADEPDAAEDPPGDPAGAAGPARRRVGRWRSGR